MALARRVALVVCLTMTVGCGGSHPLQLRADPGNPNSLALVEVYLWDRSSAFGGTGEFTLVVVNRNEGSIDDIELVFDGSWRAPLEDLRIPGEPAQLFERSDLRPGQALLFLFTPEVGNHGVFQDATGASLPSDRLPGHIAVESAQGSAGWNVLR